MQSGHNFENDAKAIREAMRGAGTDEEAIIKITGNRTSTERQQIRLMYKTAYGRDLIEDLEDDLGGDFKKVVVGMYLSPVEYDVKEIFNAVDGAGTDEDALTEILGSRSNSRIKEIAKLYKEKYNETLESRIKDEVSGDYKKLLTAIIQSNRDESTTVNQSQVSQDVKDLYDAGEGKWGTNEEVFIRIFALRSRHHLFAMNQLYQSTYKKNLIQVVESEFSGDIKVLLQTILHSQINPADYYATRIYKACKGWGTNDSQLIRALVVTDESLMEEIKQIYPKKFGVTLKAQIEDETSGDYCKMLVELISH